MVGEQQQQRREPGRRPAAMFTAGTAGFYLTALIFLVILSYQNAGGSRSLRERNHFTPIFRTTPRNITVGPGDRAVLRCRVENLGTKTVTWRKRSEAHPLTIGLFTFVGDTRISVDYNQRTNEWSLIIQDVKPTDEGIYQCQISTKAENENTYDVTLNVKTVQVSGTEYVERNGGVRLFCNATGKPDPPHDVEWFKNGEKINSDAKSGILITKKIETKVLISVLVIHKSKMSDAGDYVCRSSNRDASMIKVHILNVSTSNVKRSGTSVQRVTGLNSAAHPSAVWSTGVAVILSVLLIMRMPAQV